jgi:FMN phosphatase YigB (HAD superfamily)
MGFRAAILTDLDNTIYNWVDFFAPSFRAMVHALAREIGASEESLTEQFKGVFAEYGSLEYPYTVQKLPICRGLSHERVADLVRIAKGAFSRVRKSRLAPYSRVRETLEYAKREGIAVVAVSNAPLFYARMRVRQLHLDSLFDGVTGSKDFAPEEDDPFAEPVKERLRGKGYATGMKREWEMPAELLKPNPEVYRRVLDDIEVSASDAWVIGDSLEKDVRPALEIGAVGVWARYGTHFDRMNFETLLAITQWSPQRISKTYATNTIEPSLTIDNFSDLMMHIAPLQPLLPGFD